MGRRVNRTSLIPVFKQLKYIVNAMKGGPGSGDWGHTGRPGQIGGSGGGGGAHNLPPDHPHYKPSKLSDSYAEVIERAGKVRDVVGKWKIDKQLEVKEYKVPTGKWLMDGKKITPEAKQLFKDGKKAWQSEPDYKYIVKEYTGDSYIGINAVLRGEVDKHHSVPEYWPKKAARGVMKTAIPIEKGTMLTRGHAKIPLDNLKPGTVVYDKGILSTSISKKQSDEWGDVIWNMVVGSGVRGLPTGGFSHQKSEREVLLPPNQRIMVTNIDKSGPKSIVSAVILPTIDDQYPTP